MYDENKSCMNVQSKHETYAHTCMTCRQCEWKLERRVEPNGVASPDGSMVENQAQARTRTHAYTCTHARIHTHTHARTHTFSENMFGHSFVPFKNANTTSTAQFMCVFVCVVVVVCILAVAAVRRVKKFRKGGFPLVPLNQQQLFGTFNIY